MSRSLLDPGQIIQDVHDESDHALNVSVVGGSFSVSVASDKQDDTPFVQGTDEAGVIGAVFDDTSPDSVDEGDAGAVRMSGNRNLYTQLRDAAGNERGANVTASNALKTDSSATTQPISAASLPLPTGAATLAEQQTQTTSLQLLDDTVATTGAAITAKGFSAVGTDGTNARILKTDTSGELQIDVLSSALPSGAATSALQTTGNTSLSSIDGKVPSNLTVTSTRLLVDGSGVTQPISAASLPLPSGAATETSLAKLTLAQASTTSGQSGSLQLGAATTAAPTYTTATSNPLSLTTAGALRTDASATTQPVSGTVSASQSGTWNINNVSGTVSLPTGAATETSLAKLTQTQGSTTSGQSGTLHLGAVTTAAPTYTTAQSSPLSLTTAGALRTDASATTQPISGTVAATQSGTWNINNVSGTVSLPTGAATETTLATLNAKTAGSLTPHAYDYISLAYTGANLTTVVFKTGGSGGTTVDTLTLAYSGSTLTSVTRT